MDPKLKRNKVAALLLLALSTTAVLWVTTQRSSNPESVEMHTPERVDGTEEPETLSMVDSEQHRDSVSDSLAVEDSGPTGIEWEGHELHLTVEIHGSDGKPFPGVTVEMAPSSHPFVTFGKTDRRGLFKAVLLGRQPEMELTVTLRDGPHALATITPVTLQRDEPHHLAMTAFRPPNDSRMSNEIDDIRSSLSEIRERVNGRTEGIASHAEPQRQNFSPAQFDGLLSFGTHALYGQREFHDGIEMLDVRSRRVRNQLEALSRKVGRFGLIRGSLIDFSGNPVVGHVVRARLLDQDAPEAYATLTDENGAFTLRSKVGLVRCSFLDETGLVEREFDVTDGQAIVWDQQVSVGHAVVLRLVEIPDGTDATGYSVQTLRRSPGRTDVTIHRFGPAAELRIPSTDAVVGVMRRQQSSDVLVAPLTALSPGDQVDLDASRFAAPAPSNRVELLGFSAADLQCRPEVIVTCGESEISYRLPVAAASSGTGHVLLPFGSWDIDIRSGSYGSQVFDGITISQESQGASIMLQEYLDGNLIVETDGAISLDCEVSFLAKSYFSRNLVASHDFRHDEPFEVNLSPGSYRVVIRDKFGRVFLDERALIRANTTSRFSLQVK